MLGVYHAMVFLVFRPGAPPAQMRACTVPMVRSCFNLMRITCVYCTEAIHSLFDLLVAVTFAGYAGEGSGVV